MTVNSRVHAGIAALVALMAVGVTLGSPSLTDAASAAPGTARAKATLSVTPSSVIPGEAVVFAGRATPRVKRSFQVQQQRGKRWATVAKGSTTRKGSFRATYVPTLTPGVRATYRVRLAPLKRLRLKATLTRSRTVTGLAQQGSMSLPASTFVNKAVTVSGQFTPARPGRPVVLQQRTGAGWVDATTLAQDGTGAVSAQLGAAAPGSFDYRLTALGQAGAPAVSTAPGTVTVTADPVVVTPKLEALTTAESDALVFDVVTGQLTFGPGAPSSISEIRPGDFVAVPPRSLLGSGALVEVTSVATVAQSTVMTSTPAQLPEVVKDVPAGATEIAMPMIGGPVVTGVSDGVQVSIEPRPTSAKAPGTTGLVSLDGPEVSADVKVTLETTQGDASAKATLTGSVSVTPTVEMALDVDWFEVRSYRVGAGLEVRDSLELAAEMQFEKEWEKQLFKVSVVRGGFIGAVPVWVELTGSVNAKIDASGRVEASIAWTRDGASIVGVRGDASDGLQPHPYQESASAQASVSQAKASGDLHGEVFGKVSLELYSLVGPFVDLGYRGDATISGDTETGISCRVSHGPLARIGLSTPDLLKKMIDKTVGPLQHSFDLPQATVVECPAGTSAGRPVITTTSLPPAHLGHAYNARLTTADDRAGTWRVASGQLPRGLALNVLTGVISGTASGFEGVERLSIGFVDTAGTAASEVLLSIEVTATAPGESEGSQWVWTLSEMVQEGAAYQDQNGAYTLQRDYTLRTDVAGHYLHSTLIVPEGITLTIPPGSRIKVGHCYWTVYLPPGSCLDVRGDVQMGGDPDRPVIVTAYRDDSVGGDTDGVPPEQNYAGSGPLTISEGGSVHARGVDLRSTGFLLTGSGDSSFRDVMLRDGSVLQANGGADGTTTIARLHAAASAGSVSLTNGRHTVTDSRFEGMGWRNLSLGAHASVTDSTVSAGSVHLGGAGSVFEDNLLAETVRVDATMDGAASSFAGSRTTLGDLLRVYVQQGELYQDVTWSPGVVYALEGRARVPAGRQLTLAPGTTVVGYAQLGYFGLPGTLAVEGTLVAAGTAAAPVTLTNAGDPALDQVDTGPLAHTWGGPQVASGGTLRLTHTRVAGMMDEHRFQAGSTTVLRHVRWEAQNRVIVDDSAFTLEDSEVVARELLLFSGTVRRSALIATPLSVLAPVVDLDDVEMRGAAATLRATPTGAGTDWSGVSSTDGAVRGVLVSQGEVTGAVVWQAGIPFLPDSWVSVPAGSSLTLAPGAVVKGQSSNGWSPQGSAFLVDGSMTALGTASAPVTLTHRSDATGGATPAETWMNGDTWQGITARGSGRVDLAHVAVRGTRKFLYAPDAGSMVVLDHVDVRDGRDAPVQLESNSDDLVVRDSTFVSPSDQVGLVINGSAQLDHNRFDRVGITSGATYLRLTDNAFSDFPSPVLTVQGTNPVDAEHNWWGHGGTPVVSATWSVDADAVGPVDVDPWCLDDACSTLSPASP